MSRSTDSGSEAGWVVGGSAGTADSEDFEGQTGAKVLIEFSGDTRH